MEDSPRLGCSLLSNAALEALERCSFWTSDWCIKMYLNLSPLRQASRAPKTHVVCAVIRVKEKTAKIKTNSGALFLARSFNIMLYVTSSNIFSAANPLQPIQISQASIG